MFNRNGDFTAVWPLLTTEQRQLVGGIVRMLAAPQARTSIREALDDSATANEDGAPSRDARAMLAYLELERQV